MQKRLFQLQQALNRIGELSPVQKLEWVQSLPLSVRREFEQSLRSPTNPRGRE